MFTPIVIRRGVATLADFKVPNKKEKHPKPALADGEPLRHELGTHAECGNPMYFFRVGDTHAVITCIPCGLRIVVPKTITTYGDLRAYSSAIVEKT